jgi:hypothetical protein
VLHTFSTEHFYTKQNGKLHAHLLEWSWGRVQANRKRAFVPKLLSLDNFETILWQVPTQLCTFLTLYSVMERNGQKTD